MLELVISIVLKVKRNFSSLPKMLSARNTIGST